MSQEVSKLLVSGVITSIYPVYKSVNNPFTNH